VTTNTAIRLRGSSWAHARGHTPLVAAAQKYAERVPVHVEWVARSLNEFGVADVGELARDNDLVVIDHPHVGEVAATRCLVRLDEVLGQSRLSALAERSPGHSHQSYQFEGHQWALAIDAACQVAAHRPDHTAGELPRTWADVAELAASGQVVLAANPTDISACLLTVLGATCGPSIGAGRDFIPFDEGVAAFDMLHAVTQHLPPECFNLDAIATLETLASDDSAETYCPLVFGYTNYSRVGFRRHSLAFTDIVQFSQNSEPPLGSLLGGVGLGVSATSPHVDAAAEFAIWIAASDAQRGVYFDSGGQPAHVAAWDDKSLDLKVGGFFSATRATIEGSWTRPRADGYVAWQNRGMGIIHAALRNGHGFADAVRELNDLARHTIPAERKTP